MTQFGSYVRKLRKDADIGQHMLAETIGLANTFMCDVEKGRRMPAMDRLGVLAHTLKVSPRVLLSVWVRSKGSVELIVKSDLMARVAALLVELFRKGVERDLKALESFLAKIVRNYPS